MTNRHDNNHLDLRGIGRDELCNECRDELFGPEMISINDLRIARGRRAGELTHDQALAVWEIQKSGIVDWPHHDPDDVERRLEQIEAVDKLCQALALDLAAWSHLAHDDVDGIVELLAPLAFHPAFSSLRGALRQHYPDTLARFERSIGIPGLG